MYCYTQINYCSNCCCFDVVKIITYSGCGQSVAGCQGGTGRIGTGTRRAVENGLIVFASGAGRRSRGVGRRGIGSQATGWQASVAMQGFVDVLPDLLVLEAVEEEDENALEAVQDGEDVGHGHGRLVQVEQAKCPRQTQEEHQDE